MHVKGFVIDQVNVGLHIEDKKKFLQFVTISTFYNKDDHLRITRVCSNVCFCQSAKQPPTPLERFKCLDHG
jgi:hypothetical protein